MNMITAPRARRAALIRLLVCSTTLALAASVPFKAAAFKMGPSGNRSDVGSRSLSGHFSDPIHENMAEASIELAKRDAASLCKSTAYTSTTVPSPTVASIDEFLAAPAGGSLSHEMCCHKGAESWLCDSLKEMRTKAFSDDSLPLVTGVRWNDDICHLTRDKSTRWATLWMNGVDVGRFNNLNYASHYHELQFLHAMAPTSRTHPSDVLDAKATIRRIKMWAEFSFRVAEGTIPSDARLKDVREMLTPGMQVDFDLAWKAWFPYQVDQLFTGVKGAPPKQVRQVALGALLHTIQDSFSSSHVQRQRNRRNGYAPVLTDKGDIVRFHSYRLQSPSAHGVADGRPKDIRGASVGDLHPVSIGAELLACASAGSADSESRWPIARDTVAKAFTLANPSVNLRSNAGEGMGAGSGDPQAP